MLRSRRNETRLERIPGIAANPILLVADNSAKRFNICSFAQFPMDACKCVDGYSVITKSKSKRLFDRANVAKNRDRGLVTAYELRLVYCKLGSKQPARSYC